MDSLTKNTGKPQWFASYEELRADSYVVLASVLAQPPSRELLDLLESLEWGVGVPEKLKKALNGLRQAVREATPAAVQGEFDRLFVGLGCGEAVPYASWYREKRIQSLPLALLRADLISLGIIRQDGNREPEDSAGTLCEIMALLSQEESGIPYEEQAGFFQRHLDSWMSAFFRDLQRAKSACFYRAVGLFGVSFLESEKQYLQEGIASSSGSEKGGKENEGGIFR